MSHLDRAFVIPKSEQRDAAKARICAYIDRLPDTSLWSVKVAATKPQRSENQNSLLWALYTDIIRMGGEAMQGHTKEELHDFFLGNHTGWVIKDVFGRKKQVPFRRSSDMNKQEFSDFVESIVRFMAEEGVVLSLPGEMAA